MASKKEKKEDSNITSEDTMTRCVTLCQEQKWREAALAGRQFVKEMEENGNVDFAEAFANGALKKIDYSLRRQMATALIKNAKIMLEKEFLLNVTK